MSITTDFAIVGGGVIGCAIAYEMSRAGARCLLIDSHDPGSEASGASGGIISHPSPGTSSYFNLRKKGHAYFQCFVEQLRQDTSIDFGFLCTGSLEPCFNDAEKNKASKYLEKAHREGLLSQFLLPVEVKKLEPRISTEIVGAVFHEEDYQVQPKRFVQALADGAVSYGTTLLLHETVKKMLFKDSKVIGVETTNEKIFADTVILAAGAWSRSLIEDVGFNLLLEPSKGQVVELEAPPNFLNHIVRGHDVNCIPCAKGNISLGATVENVGFDKRITVDGIRKLLNAAIEVIPDIKSLSITRYWAGLRPRSGRWGGPYLGPVPSVDNLIVATGHYRTGLSLAPITARLIKEWLLDGEPSIPLKPFRLDRLNRP